MAFMFEHSCLATKPELDLFSQLPTQASIEEGFHTEHQPTNTLLENNPIKFTISGDSNYYIDLASSYLYLEMKITKSDGSEMADDDNCGPINLIGQTIFQQIEISLNDAIITDPSNLYHYRAIFETLLSYGYDAKNSQLTLSLYSKDKASAMDSIDDTNTGLVKRREYFKKSAVVPMICKIHADMFFQHRYLINGVDLRIKLIRNPDKLVLMSAEDATFKLKITNASFFARKIRLNAGIQLSHIQKLDKELQPALYPVRKVTMKSFNIPVGSLSYNENIFSGILPKRIVVALVESSSFEGAYNKNPFNFKNFKLKFCSIICNSNLVPRKPLTSDFTKKIYLRNYFSLFEATGKAFSDQGIGFDRNEYSEGYSLLAFDLSPDLDAETCFHMIKKGDIRLELNFDEALTNPVNAIIYGEQDSEIKIDKNRSVLPSYYT
jgi:hypothetical protein